MELWNKYMVTVNNCEWIECRLLDAVIGKELPNKYRKLEPIVKELVAGTRWTVGDVFRKTLEPTSNVKAPLVMAAHTMQLLLLRGFKPEMPWNETRRSLVRHFFTSAVIPDEGPGPFTTRYIGDAAGPAPAPAAPAPAAPAPAAPVPAAPARAASVMPVAHAIHAIRQRAHDRAQENVQTQIRRWKRPPHGAKEFWRQVFLFARKTGISVLGLAKFMRENAGKRNNYGKILLNGILSKRGGVSNFCDHLAITMKTGNMETLINVIRAHIAVKGLQIVPAIRKIKMSTANLVHHFIAICQPERTYSGFRADIVASVRLIAFLLLKRTDISGLEVRKFHKIYT